MDQLLIEFFKAAAAGSSTSSWVLVGITGFALYILWNQMNDIKNILKGVLNSIDSIKEELIDNGKEIVKLKTEVENIKNK